MTRPVQVGFDYDEPIYPWYDLAHKASVKAGLVPEDFPKPTTWETFEEYGCTPEEWYAVIDNEILHGDMYVQPLSPEVVAMIRRLYNRGYGIHIVTARGGFGPLGPKIQEITKSEIIKHGLPYDTLNFSKDKGKTCAELGLDYFIDDHPKYVDLIHRDSPTTEVFLLDAPWNAGLEGYQRVESTKKYVDLILDRHGFQNVLSPAQRRHVTDSEIPVEWIGSGRQG